MRTIEINIGGHNEIVRWWSADYWKMRKFREKQFTEAVERRKRMWSRIREIQEKARTGPRMGSPEWIEHRDADLAAKYREANIDQIEQIMPGADARRVADFLAYEGSRKQRLNRWARNKAWRGAYWRTTNIYQAVMNEGIKALIRRTNHAVSLYDLNSTEKIRVGRFKGDGYHGCGARQRPSSRMQLAENFRR